MKHTALALFVTAAALACGCAPPKYPATLVMKPAPTTFTGVGRCVVRAEPLAFDPAATWAGTSEAQFIAGLDDDQKASHEADKVGMGEWYFEHLKLNEPDYVGGLGKVTAEAGAQAPFVLRSRVVAVGASAGVTVTHEVYEHAASTKVAEFTVAGENVGFGFGGQLRAGMILQAMGVLTFFRENFACAAPAK